MSFHLYLAADLHLQTSKVLLRPLCSDDFDNFLPITASPGLWSYFTKELNDPEQLRLWLNEALEEKANKKRVPFTIIDKASGAVCGCTSYGNISFFDRRIEIGWTWLGETFLGSGINRHCKYALLRYAFDTMNFERVEIKTDNLNERAKQALRKIGATEEGVLRSHMQMPGNRRRDSVYYSILQHEWVKTKETVFARIDE